MSRYFVVMLFALSLLQVSCALSPQQVTIKPDIKVPVASYGAGQEVNVRSEDQRTNSVIGTRGGVYGDSSSIEIGNDAKTEIAYAVSNGFSRWGFKTQVDGNSKDATQVLVALTGLRYIPDSNPAIGKVQITASVSVEVKQNGATYRGSYDASGEMGYVTVPSQAKNNAQINLILNLALQKIFEDRALIAFLQ